MNGIVIADAGPIFSLTLIDKLTLLDTLFDDILISRAVWDEISRDETKPFYTRACEYFKDKVRPITGRNELTFIMDFGESESVILYQEVKADYLLIDDKKARSIAENFGVTCIGTLGLLTIAKTNGYIDALRPIFLDFIKYNRYYSTDLLNSILENFNEEPISYQS